MANGKDPVIVRVKAWSRYPIRTLAQAARENVLHTVVCDEYQRKTQCESQESGACSRAFEGDHATDAQTIKRAFGRCRAFNVTTAIEEQE